MPEYNDDFEKIILLLSELSDDSSVPRNIRRGAEDAKNKLEENDSMDIKVANAIFILDELVNDPNIPMHGRTILYTIIGMLEFVSQKVRNK